MTNEPRIQIDNTDAGYPTDEAKLHRFPFLDEFVMDNVDVHFETMDHCEFWIGVTDRESGRHWSINCGAVSPRARGYATVEED